MVTVASWMKQALNNCNMDKLSVYSMREDFNNYFNKNTSEESFKRNVRIYYNEMIGKDSDIDEETLIKLAASRQGFMDKNNHERKVNRESFRVFNTLEALFTEYNELLKKTDLSSYKIQKESTENAKYGVIQITYTHFNEFIAKNESSGNEYNFSIASKRLKKVCTRVHTDSENLRCYRCLYYPNRRLDKLKPQAFRKISSNIVTN